MDKCVVCRGCGKLSQPLDEMLGDEMAALVAKYALCDECSAKMPSGVEQDGLQKALRLIEYHRGVLRGDGVNVKPAPGAMAALDRVENSIRCELEHGPSASVLLDF